MLSGFCSKIVEIDVSVLRARYDDHSHAGHDGARRIGAVRRSWNQHDVAIGLTPIALECTNHHQAGKFALGTGVGLERDSVEAGDRAKGGAEIAKHGMVAVG